LIRVKVIGKLSKASATEPRIGADASLINDAARLLAD